MILYGFIISLVILLTFMTLNTAEIKSQSKKYKITLVLIIFLIALFRIYKYNSAMGLNVDEAMGGYNAWCIANYGVDSHLMKLPVYLVAWGAGMNILYPMISIPFVKLFGLNLLSYRFPMILLSIISMFALYLALMKSIKNPKFNLLFISILYLNPWMIMANRWSLESNLFPIMMIFVLSAFLMFIKEKSGLKSNLWFILFSILVGLSAYAYSNDWPFLAIFVFLIFILLIRLKLVNIKRALVGIISMLIVVWPLLLFVYVNYFGHQTLHVLGLTIPELWGNRSESQMIFGNGTPILLAMFKNFLQNINVLITDDGLIWNSLPGIGLMFPGMFLIALIGIIYAIKNIRKLSILNTFMIILLVASFPILLLVVPNANHMNALILPIFYFETLGLKLLLNTSFLKRTAVCIFALMLMWFSFGYFKQFSNDLSNKGTITSLKLEKICDEANKTNKTIYLINNQNGGMFSITRFWEPISPYEFNETKSNDPKTAIMNYQYYGKWHFKANTDTQMKNLNNSIFIILSSELPNNINNLPNNIKKIGDFGEYVVFEN